MFAVKEMQISTQKKKMSPRPTNGLEAQLAMIFLFLQHYPDERHVVERHGRDTSGPRKEWHGPPSQGPSYHDTRRMGDGRTGAGMMTQHGR